MKFYRYLIEKKAELTGDQYKDKFIKELNKWDTDLSRMTKAYKSLKAMNKKDILEIKSDGTFELVKNFKNNKDIKEFKKLKTYFITFAKNFENWVYTKILDNRKIKEEGYYQTQVRKTAWMVYINLNTGTLFPNEYIYQLDKNIDAPWLLDSNYKNNSRKTNITRYQNSWRKFKKAFMDMVNYESEKIDQIGEDEQIQVSGVTIVIKNKPNNKESDKYIKSTINHLRKIIPLIKKEGLSKAIKDFGIEFNFNPSTIPSLTALGLVSGAYDKNTDKLYLFPLRIDKITDSTLIHEIGHRYWFKHVSNKAQKAWEDKINSKVVKVEEKNIKDFFDIFYNKEKYFGFPMEKEVLAQIDKKINNPNLKVIYSYLANNIPVFDTKGKDERTTYLDWMIKRNKGEQIPLEWISEYGRTNPVEAFAEAFKIWVGGQKGKLGPWTRAFFKEIVSTGGSNIKEQKEILEKYI